MADTYKTIRCPACGNKMKKIFIPSAGVNIDICADGCGGIYFDNQELQIIRDGSDEGIKEINKHLEGKDFIEVDKNETRVCPNCSTNMVHNNIDELNIQIDTCYNCGGVFLDYGELDLIRKNIKHARPKRRSHNAQNTIVTDELRQFYREAQHEENLHNILFKKRYSGFRFGRRFNILDLLFLLLR